MRLACTIALLFCSTGLFLNFVQKFNEVDFRFQIGGCIVSMALLYADMLKREDIFKR